MTHQSLPLLLHTVTPLLSPGRVGTSVLFHTNAKLPTLCTSDPESEKKYD